MPKCNELRIQQFLQHELTQVEELEFEQHLESCNTCCGRLHDTVADRTWWDQATRMLPDQPDDFEKLAHVDTRADMWPNNPSSRVSDAGETSLPAAVQNVVNLLAPTDDPQMLGRIGNYEVAGVVGAGGMSVVLKALDPSLNRFVAIKVLAPHLATSGAARMRFAREAQAAAAIVHDNVIAIHGVDEAMGLPYLVMPYVKGQSLQKRLDDQGPLELKEILRIATQVAAGLSAAHAQGLIHRDVKPANIMLADGVERVTITDFGLARAADDASLTRTGTIAGTPQFMSPEQARGDTVDQRSDLFSLGSVIYAMCAGHAPFRAESSYGVLRRIADSEPRVITDINSELPNWLCKVIQRLHAKLPQHRYASAADVASDLEQCLAHVQQPSREPLPSGLVGFEFKRFTTRHWRSIASVMVVATVLVLTVLGIQATKAPHSLDVNPAEAQDGDRTGTLAENDSQGTTTEPDLSSPIQSVDAVSPGRGQNDNAVSQTATWVDGTDAELLELELATSWLEEELRDVETADKLSEGTQ